MRTPLAGAAPSREGAGRPRDGGLGAWAHSSGVFRHFSDEKLSARYTETVIRLLFALLKKRLRMTSSGVVLRNASRFFPQKAAHTPDSVSAKTTSLAETISTIFERRRRNESFRLAASGSCVSCSACSRKLPKRSRAHFLLKLRLAPPESSRFAS